MPPIASAAASPVTSTTGCRVGSSPSASARAQLADATGGHADAMHVHQGIDAAIAELRGLVQGVMPPLLLERGLYATTEDLVERMPRCQLASRSIRAPPGCRRRSRAGPTSCRRSAVERREARPRAITSGSG